MLAAAAPGAGVAGAVLLAPDGRVRSAGRALVGRGRIVDLHPGVPGDHPAVRGRAVRLLSGELVAVARDALLDTGGLDLAFGAGVAEADLCMRMWDAGRENAVAGAVAVLHGDAPAPSADDEKAFRRRWHAAPPDRDELLAEDGVADPGWADCVWEGPLLDDSPEAAEGRDALRALAAAGRRPMAREPEGAPLAPDAAGWCDEAILAALNRHRVGAPGSETFRRAPVPGSALRPAGREGIGWLGALLGRSGYAAAARGVVQAAHRAGLPGAGAGHRRAARWDGAARAALPPQDFAPGLIVIHGLPVMPSGIPFWDEATADLGLPVVGATCFETELMPPSWVEPCNRTREVWVPSGFNARTFADAGVNPERIHVVPYPVDTDRLRPAGRERDPGAPVTFLSIFEWTWRKGWDVLLQAWAEEFASGDPVRLVVVTYRGAGAAGEGTVEQQALAHLAALGAGPDDIADIELVLDPVPHDAMPGLYASADAFVLPTPRRGRRDAGARGRRLRRPRDRDRLGRPRGADGAGDRVPGGGGADGRGARRDARQQCALPGAAAGRAVGRVAARRDARRCRRPGRRRGPRPARPRPGGGALLDRRGGGGARRARPGPALRAGGGGPVNIVWRGPVTDPSGYSAGGRAFLRGFEEEGAAVRLEPHMWNAREAIDAAERRRLVAMSEREMPDVDASVQHTFGRLVRPVRPRPRRVGRTCSRPTASPPTGSGGATRWTRCGCRAPRRRGLRRRRR